jgi:hypothetical protein
MMREFELRSSFQKWLTFDFPPPKKSHSIFLFLFFT